MNSKPLPGSDWKFLRETETCLIYYKYTNNDCDLVIKGKDVRNYYDKVNKKYNDITKRGYEYLVLDKEYIKKQEEERASQNILGGKHS